MKKILILLICVLVGQFMAACQPGEEPDMGNNDFGALLNEKIEGTKVHLGDVNDFYYTYEWVGYNAEYQRYRFFVEDGKYKFYHEARKIEGDYGWASEKDITSQGTVELTEDEWAQFLGTIRTGELKKPKESLEDEVESLINGGSVRKRIHQELTYRDLYASMDNIWSVLFMTA